MLLNEFFLNLETTLYVCIVTNMMMTTKFKNLHITKYFWKRGRKTDGFRRWLNTSIHRWLYSCPWPELMICTETISLWTHGVSQKNSIFGFGGLAAEWRHRSSCVSFIMNIFLLSNRKFSRAEMFGKIKENRIAIHSNRNFDKIEHLVFQLN